MLRRLFAILLLVWIFGFAWFAVMLPGPSRAGSTDAVVVFTGGEGRIDRGLEILRQDKAPRLLVSGVDREVRPEEFAAEYEVSDRLMECCVELGYDAYDTRSNAVEASRWLARIEARNARLITTDWHMRRAAFELDQLKPIDVAIVRDAVASEPSLRILFLEYHKWLAREVSWLWDA